MFLSSQLFLCSEEDVSSLCLGGEGCLRETRETREDVEEKEIKSSAAWWKQLIKIPNSFRELTYPVCDYGFIFFSIGIALVFYAIVMILHSSVQSSNGFHVIIFIYYLSPSTKRLLSLWIGEPTRDDISYKSCNTQPTVQPSGVYGCSFCLYKSLSGKRTLSKSAILSNHAIEWESKVIKKPKSAKMGLNLVSSESIFVVIGCEALRGVGP